MPNEITALTDDNQIVILRPNGRWIYATETTDQRSDAEDDGFRDVAWGSGRERTIYILRADPPEEHQKVVSTINKFEGLNSLVYP
jgi:hypothetical protein